MSMDADMEMPAAPVRCRARWVCLALQPGVAHASSRADASTWSSRSRCFEVGFTFTPTTSLAPRPTGPTTHTRHGPAVQTPDLLRHNNSPQSGHVLLKRGSRVRFAPGHHPESRSEQPERATVDDVPCVSA